MRVTVGLLGLALIGTWACTPTARPPQDSTASLYELTANTLGGAPRALSAYQGKVALVVNTASECGFTPQYAGLQALYAEYKDRGFVVLGFPSNDFGGQEPGTAAEIQTFCRKNYGVAFPMFEKVATKGVGQSPVYRFLSASHGEPQWNFHKYLVGKDGRVRQAFSSKVEPKSAELHLAIDAALDGAEPNAAGPPRAPAGSFAAPGGAGPRHKEVSDNPVGDFPTGKSGRPYP